MVMISKCECLDRHSPLLQPSTGEQSVPAVITRANKYRDLCSAHPAHNGAK
jgi:hypothetical protein